MYLLSILNIGDSISEGFFGLCISLDSIIYGLVSSAYKIFMALAGARILNSDMFNEIANKIYIIIGVLMLFVLAYALLRGIINPDGLKSGNTSAPNIIKSVIVAVLGLALTPVIFNLMYQAQGVFVENDVLARIIFRDVEDSIPGGTVDAPIYDENGNTKGSVTLKYDEVEYNKAIKKVGGAFTATELWKAFFRPDTAGGGSPETIVAVDGELLIKNGELWALGLGAVAAAVCYLIPGVGWLAGAAITAGTVVAVGGTISGVNSIADAINTDEITLKFAYTYASSGEEGGFDLFACFIRNYIGIDAHGDEIDPDQRITYLWGISGIAGIFALYAFVSFGIDMAVRAVKLAYYQIIAPIPLILQILPNFKSNFSKYVKSVLSTFAEVFIRISVVYIVVYLIAHLGESALFNNDMLEAYNLKAMESAVAMAILIIGLVTFAKSAPKIISDTFGIQSGSMNLGITKKLAEGGALTAAAAIGAGVTGGVRNAAHAFANKERWKNASGRVTAGSVLGNVGRGLASTVAGTASGFVRGGYSARNAKSFADVKKSAVETSNIVTDRRDKREQFANEHGSRAGLAHLQNVGTAIQDWAVGSVDTSYYDGRMKLDQSISKFKSDLDSTISKDRYVMDQQNRVSSLERMNATDYAYTNEVMQRAASRVGFRVKAANETAEDYRKALETWIAADTTGVRKTNYDRINHDITNNASDADYMNRANFVLDPNSREYREAEMQLNNAISAANKEFKNIKSDAVHRALVQAAATGIGNDTSRMYNKFFEEHMDELRKYGNVTFGDSSQTLEDYIASTFGRSALSGTADMDMVLRNGSDYKFDVTINNPGGTTSKETVYYDAATGTYRDSTGATFDMRRNDIKVDQVTSGRAGVYDETTRVKSSVSNFNDVADRDQDMVSGDPNYVAARARRRRSQQNNSGNR